MSIFAGKQSYSTKWTVKSVEDMLQEDKEATKEAIVVEGQYGLSVKFIMKSGNMFFIPLDQTSVASVGDKVNLDKAKVITFEKQGCADVTKIRI